ncbi:MAG: hypothetical protein SOT80_10810, partial [Candidatus Pseudoruminococcus sp.]|nr:hypothetical protein [Candidatus Pseudoruminococcus sp.]
MRSINGFFEKCKLLAVLGLILYQPYFIIRRKIMAFTYDEVLKLKKYMDEKLSVYAHFHDAC